MTGEEKYAQSVKAYEEKLSKMLIQDQIGFEMKISMKNGNPKLRDLMRVVMGEFATVNKNSRDVTDEQALKVIKKMHSNAIEMNNDYEVAVLERWVPKELGEEETIKVIREIIVTGGYNSMKDIGKIMSALKEHRVNMKIAGGIVRTELKE